MKKMKLMTVLLACVLMVMAVAPAAATALSFEREDPMVIEETIPNEQVPTEVNLPIAYDADGREMPRAFISDGANETEIETARNISISMRFNVSVGQSWSKTFNTGNFWVDDHNAFKVIVSDVEGNYKILIKDNKGYEYESPEYTNQGTEVTIVNAWSDRDFTVYILNLSTSSLTGHVKISSFYNQ